MAFTEFYCQSGGDNLNAGSTTGNAAAQTYAGGTFVRATGVFTVASGDPSADGVAVGDFASIYTTAGATVATFIGRVTARSTTTITVSLTAISGAASSVSETAAAATCKVGGAWKGPNAAAQFPFAFAVGTMTNASGDRLRINFKNDADYDVTVAIAHGLAGPITVQGYSSSPGDGGRATLKWTASVTNGFDWSNGSSGGCEMTDFILTVSGAGSVNWLFANQSTNHWSHITRRVTAKASGTVRGFYSAPVTLFIECEAYTTGTGGTGFYAASERTIYDRCISHGWSATGFESIGQARFFHCIAYENGTVGFYATGSEALFINCDSYDNGSEGFYCTSSLATPYLVNCNAVSNGAYGIRLNNQTVQLVLNCGFSDNSSGETNGVAADYVIGSVSYGAGVTPWVAPASGDFRINLAAAKGAGRGTFTQSESGESGTVGYPDIGAAQHQDAGGGGGPGPSTRQVVGAGRRWSL